ncbi:hypothetical protein ACQ4PT_029370 [Festuca glaucescens]
MGRRFWLGPCWRRESSARPPSSSTPSTTSAASAAPTGILQAVSDASGLCTQAAELLVAAVYMEIGCCGRRRIVHEVPAILAGVVAPSLEQSWPATEEPDRIISNKRRGDVAARSVNLAETDEDVSDGIESDKEDDQMETLAREVVDRIGSSRKNLLPVLEQMAASSEKSVIIPDNTKAKCKKQAWGPVVATSKMATRNHGGQNVIEKAKEYQKHKNLEVPPSFKGNSFALLHSDVLNGMSRQVNIKIGNDTCDSTFVINELIDNELNQNLKFARDNPTVVLPDNLDVGDVQLSDLSHPRSLISTRSVPDHQLIDPGLGAIVTGRDNSLINNYTSGLS